LASDGQAIGKRLASDWQAIEDSFQLPEVIAKPQKTGAKPMGQNVHAGCKTSNGAALAASTIVHCQLSIVNFSGFAIGSLI
jgi:hypothetical protein